MFQEIPKQSYTLMQGVRNPKKTILSGNPEGRIY
jgi:hypothetical protein